MKDTAKSNDSRGYEEFQRAGSPSSEDVNFMAPDKVKALEHYILHKRFGIENCPLKDENQATEKSAKHQNAKNKMSTSVVESSPTLESTSESSTLDSSQTPVQPSRVKAQPEILKAEAKKKREAKVKRRKERKEEREREKRRLERHSRKEEKKRDGRKERRGKKSSQLSRSKKSQKLDDPKRCRPTDTSKRCIRQYYAGVRTADEMNRKVRRSQFRLYYKIDPSVDMAREVQLSIPLYVAYKDSKRNMYHFPVTTTEHELYGRKWSIDLPGNDQKASFSSLPKLLEYYEVYNFVHPKDGSIEVFPVWLISEAQEN